MVPGTSEASALPSPVWREIGDPPEAVTQSLERRAGRIRRLLAGFGGVVVGGLVGFVVVFLLSAPQSGALASRLEWFFAVGLPVGLLEFFGTIQYLKWLDRRLRFQPRRIALQGRTLIGELASGERFDCPLTKIQLARDPVAADWYTVTLPLGRMRRFFLVPGPVAAEIRAAGPFTA